MRFFEPIAGQAVKEAFMRLGYHKQTNSHEEAIHHLIGTKTSLFAYLLVQWSCFAIPLSFSLVLTKSSSVLSTRFFSCRSKFTVYCTQNSGWLKSSMSIYHVFTLEEWLYRPKKLTYDTRPSQSLRRGCGVGNNFESRVVVLIPEVKCCSYVHLIIGNKAPKTSGTSLMTNEFMNIIMTIRFRFGRLCSNTINRTTIAGFGKWIFE